MSIMWAADIAAIGKLMIPNNEDRLAILKNVNYLVCEQDSEQDSEQDGDQDGAGFLFIAPQQTRNR